MAEPNAQTPASPLRKYGLSAFALVFPLALLVWWLTIAPRPKFYLTTCLQDASGLKQGAPVMIAGVDVGYVQKLRAQPQDAACPGFVEMAFTADYELQIPRDGVVSTATAGLLGESYLDVDGTRASGLSAQNGDSLPSRQRRQPSLDDVVRAIRALPATVETFQALKETEKSLEEQDGKLPAKGIRPKQKSEK